MTDLSFPDLRAFLDQLRRDGDLVVVEAEVDPAPRGGRDPPPRDRGRRAGAAVHERPRRGLPARHQPLRHRAAGRAGLRRRARERLIRRSSTSPRRSCRPTPGKLWGARDVGREALQGRPHARERRAGHRGGDRRRAPRPPARPHLLARGRRPVRHAAARLHRAPGRPGRSNLGMYRLHVHDDAHHRHALADRQGRRLPLRGGRGPGRGPARHRLPRRPARADPRRDRAAARRTCPS